MADEVDQATDAAQRWTDAVLKDRQRPAAATPIIICVSCGDQIEPDRKAAVPSTNLCADCAREKSRT